MARILLVTHIYPPAIDGGSRVIASIEHQFNLNGHQTLVLTSNASSTDDFTHRYQKINNAGLPIYTIFHRPLKLLSKFVPTLKVFSKGPLFKLIPFTRFLFKCLKFRPEYIVAGPLPTTIVLYALLLKKITGSKLIINASFHSSDPEFHQPLLIHALQSADFVWTLTKFETDYFHQIFGIPYTKLINIGNGIDSRFISPKYQPPTSFNLLFVGSFAAHKGIETLIVAFTLLPNQYTLTLAGNKTLYTPTILKKIKLLPSESQARIKVIFSFPQKSLSTLIDNCRLLISASNQESFGLVLLEAMARGRNFIAADIPASIEMAASSHAGRIFKQNDPTDLADKIISFQPNDLSLHFAKNHTWDKIYKKLWEKVSS